MWCAKPAKERGKFSVVNTMYIKHQQKTDALHIINN